MGFCFYALLWRQANGTTALQIAAQAGYVSQIEALLQSGASVDETDSNDRTALMYACYFGRHTAVQRLLAAGANVHHRERCANTQPLTYAVSSGNVAVVETLLQAGAMIDHVREDGCTALRVACQRQDLVMVKTLLAAGANVHQRNSTFIVMEVGDSTPLMFAAQFQSARIVERLLMAGADVDVVDEVGESPVLVACAKSTVEMVELLLSVEANLGHADQCGWTALHYAAQTGSKEGLRKVKYLVAVGATVDIVETDTIGSILDSRGVDGVKATLAEAGEVCLGETTAIVKAAERGNIALVKVLLAAGADVNVRDGYETPLLAAVWCGRTDVICLLLDAFADVDATDGNGNTALQRAVHCRHTKIAEILRHYAAAEN